MSISCVVRYKLRSKLEADTTLIIKSGVVSKFVGVHKFLQAYKPKGNRCRVNQKDVEFIIFKGKMSFFCIDRNATIITHMFMRIGSQIEKDVLPALGLPTRATFMVLPSLLAICCMESISNKKPK